MLILRRRPGEAIRIGNDVVIVVLSVHGQRVRLGIEAPRHVPIDRDEPLDPECLQDGQSPCDEPLIEDI